MTTHAVYPYPPLRLLDKIVTATTWGCAIAIFATVGWMSLSPSDPQGAVCLSVGGRSATIPQVVALAAVVAAVATAVIGRRLPEAGTFAVAIGLATAALQGGSSSYLLINVTGVDVDARRQLCLSLLFESVVWLGVIGVAAVVSAWVMRWCYGRDEAVAVGSSASSRLANFAVCDVPFLGRMVCGAAGSEPTRPRLGMLHTGVMTLTALLLFRIVSGSPTRTVQHGQACFAVAAAFFVGGYVAHRFFPVRTPLWGCFSVALTCIIGYVWTMLKPLGAAPYAEVASVPPTAFIRALPVDYFSVGTAAVLVSFWGRARSARGHDRDEKRRR